MKRVLMLAPVPVSSAATRFRLHQFIPALNQAGFAAEIRPFLTASELQVLYGRGTFRAMSQAALSAIARRVLDLASASRADVVVIQREAALIGPPILEWIITKGLRCPIVFDFDDAVWEPYTSPVYGRWLPRLFKMPGKARFTITAARQVIAGNNYLARYASQHNRCVTVLPTIVDTAVFTPRPLHNDTPVLGWIGSHSTSAYLVTILPALARVARTHGYLLRVIGADNATAQAIARSGVPHELLPWRLESEVSQFQSLDVGLYPIRDDAWSRGKSGFKAVQYMACGVPVVASPVGSVTEMICTGANGFLPDTEHQWVEAITRLLEDKGLRERMGGAGREAATKHWSLQKFAPVFVDVIERALM